MNKYTLIIVQDGQQMIWNAKDHSIDSIKNFFQKMNIISMENVVFLKDFCFSASADVVEEDFSEVVRQLTFKFESQPEYKKIAQDYLDYLNNEENKNHKEPEVTISEVEKVKKEKLCDPLERYLASVEQDKKNKEKEKNSHKNVKVTNIDDPLEKYLMQNALKNGNLTYDELDIVKKMVRKESRELEHYTGPMPVYYEMSAPDYIFYSTFSGFEPKFNKPYDGELSGFYDHYNRGGTRKEYEMPDGKKVVVDFFLLHYFLAEY